jgi:hypothetical protein
MPVWEILMSQPWWGPVRARRLLRSAAVPEYKDLGSLSPRQRQVLVETLERRAAGARIHELGSS